MHLKLDFLLVKNYSCVHELIHALRAMNGNMKFDKYGIFGSPWYLRPWKKRSTADQEELDTVGINYSDDQGNYYPASEWPMTENALRKENGLPRRVRY